MKEHAGLPCSLQPFRTVVVRIFFYVSLEPFWTVMVCFNIAWGPEGLPQQVRVQHWQLSGEWKGRGGVQARLLRGRKFRHRFRYELPPHFGPDEGARWGVGVVLGGGVYEYVSFIQMFESYLNQSELPPYSSKTEEGCVCISVDPFIPFHLSM